MVNCGINTVSTGIISKASKKPNKIFLPEKFTFAKAKPASALTIIEPIANVPA